MKTHGLMVMVFVASLAAASAPPVSGGQADAALRSGCDDLEVTKAKARFVRLRDLRKVDRGAVSMDEFREAAKRYVQLAQACYEHRYGAAAKGPLRIDDDGVWMEGSVPEFNTANGRKWGAGSPYAGGQDVPGPGLPGGTVTWSYMPNGVNLTPENPGLAPNTAIQSLATFQGCFETEVDDAFDAWSAVADIQFAQVTDNGVEFGNPAGVGDIRIGAHVFDGGSGVLAHGFFPPPNGLGAAGDIHFDLAENWDCVDTGPQIDFGIVMIHELGHAIGLSHETPPPTAIMNPFYNPAVSVLQPDDIAGVESIYGAGGGCTLNVDLSYTGGTFTMDFDLGAGTPTTWNAWFIWGESFLVPLWSIPIPAVSPPVSFPISFALPALGNVGVLTTLNTAADGIACSDFATVDTTP
jgi:Matrixin